MEPIAIEAAAAHVEARFGVPPRGVIPANDLRRGALFVCAVPRDEAFGWVVIDEAGVPLDEPAAIRQVVELAAICEAAEETAAALSLDEALPLLADAWRLAGELGEADAELATHAMYQALEQLQPLVDGLRVADPTYLDQLAAAAALVGDRFDLLKETAGGVSARLTGAGIDPLEPLAEALWNAIRMLAREGAPDRFRENVEGAMGAARAFADDVVAQYLVPLDGAAGDDTEDEA
ncbi:MAG: hypothetical protein ACR2JV_02975 [Gaiellales bacterium]